jgi:cytochrome b subunit of formate dehydrogenase
MGVKDPGKLYSLSVHGQLVEKGRMDAANCAFCHGVHDIKNRIQPGSSISSFNVPDTCGLCHGEIELAYQQSIHWVRAKKGVKDAPVCNDCHSEHSVHAINTLDKAREVRQVQEETCFNCHQNPLIARRYSITGDRTHQYRDSYHGMAVLRGDPDAAMCIDCHGEHKILPRNHPESTVNDVNLVATCRKCHPDANMTFATGYSHITTAEPSLLIESWVEWIYISLIWMVIGGMLLHNAVIFGFEVRRHRRRGQETLTLPRFTPGEVVQHTILTLAFLVLVVTGFALTYSEAWVFGWLNLLGMTETVRQYTHRTAGVVLLATGFYHVGYLVSTRRGRFLLSRLMVGPGDVIEAVQNVLYHLRLRSRPPAAEQFDYTEKAEYWALIWGTVIMGVTGFILWYPTTLGQYGPVWVIKVSEIVHFYEAVLATLAILVWHGFYVMLHPREYPLSFTMVDGRISLAHFREHHRRSYDRMVEEYRAMRAGTLPRERLSYDTAWLLESLERSHISPEEVFRAE